MSAFTQIAGFDSTGSRHPRRKTYGVKVGHVQVGSGAPVVVQSMTNTDTADIESTLKQTLELAGAVLCLSSERSSFTTGQFIAIDGGFFPGPNPNA